MRESCNAVIAQVFILLTPHSNIQCASEKRTNAEITSASTTLELPGLVTTYKTTDAKRAATTNTAASCARI